jgi:uncharacterized protein (DUF58 family)
MTVSGVLGWLNIQKLKVGIDFPDENYCNHETLATVRLTNDKHRFPSFLLRVTVMGESVVFDLLGCGEEGRGSFTCRFRERGEHLIPVAEISSPFPINFFVRSRWSAVQRRVVVFPAPFPCSLPAGHDGRDRSGAVTASAKGFDGDVTKIADYSGAEPLKLVHWRLSAKHGELKVKELSATAAEPVLLDVAAMAGNNLEENLSRAAFLVNALGRKNRPVGLKLGERLLPPAASREHRLRLLTELALYGKN